MKYIDITIHNNRRKVQEFYMAKKNLLQEAIAEAKQVRETAIQNAYEELKESLTPSIRAALAEQLEEEIMSEEDETSSEEPIEENTNSGFKEVKAKKPKTIKEEDEEEPDGDENGGEADGSHPEPDGEEKPDGDENGGEAMGDHPEPDGDEPEEGDEMPAEEPEEGSISDDTEVGDMTIGDLKDVLTDFIAQITGTAGETAPGGEEGVDMNPADVEGAGEEEAPLQNADEPAGMGPEFSEPNKGDNEEGEKKDNDEEIDLSEILKELEEEQKVEKARKVVSHSQDSEEVKKLRKENKEMKEAIAELRESLKGTNLLNAKLLYTTRILGRRNLSESQRVRVIKSFDVAQTSDEVKVIYQTLNESFEADSRAAKNTVIKEHRQPASKAAGMSTARGNNDIITVDPVVQRMQKLAGII